MAIEHHIIEALTLFQNKQGCPGILCAIRYKDITSTYAVGSIVPSEHAKSFYIYGITNTFIATATLLLFKKEGLSLDKPITNFRLKTPISSSATIRQILNHTAGFSDYLAAFEYQMALYEHPSMPWSYERIMQVGLEKSPLFKPGTNWKFSNLGYALVREIIDQITGVDFGSYLQEVIFDPLGLVNTKLSLETDHDLQFLKTEEPLMQGDFRQVYSPRWVPQGCLSSTVGDLVYFYEKLLSGQLLNNQYLSEMKRMVDVPAPLPAPLKAQYGLGVMHVKNDPLGDAYGHVGGGPGYTAYAQSYLNFHGAPFSISIVATKTVTTMPLELAAKISALFL